MAPKRKPLPRPLPTHSTVMDTEKRKWRLGRMIGQGGFGLIYLASDDVDRAVSEDTDYVIKVEYHDNGPLFSELKFYQRAAKPDIICKWKRSKTLNFLGIPTYWGSGLTEYNGTRYRFMVMDRLGTDLQKVFVGNGEQIKKQTVLQLGYLMVDVLEYIHENEYVHADIKAANLLLGHRDPGKVYLADYGLSYRYSPNGEHKQYSENPKKGHNGTIEYTSIDAHKGVAPSRRGDLEVLGYCLLHWQSGTLPWLSVLRNPSQVQEAKAKLMEALPDSVTQISPSLAEVAQFLLIIRTLDYKEKPDYSALRKVLADARPLGPLDLSRPGEAAGLAVNRNSGPARPSAPSALVTEDGDKARAKTDCRSKGKSRAQEQTPHKSNLAVKTRTRTRPSVNYCEDKDEEEDDDDDDDFTLPSRVHAKTREGQKQRQRRQKSATVNRSRKTGVRNRHPEVLLHHKYSLTDQDEEEEEEEEEEEVRPRSWDYDQNQHYDDEYTHMNNENLNKPDLQQSFRKCVSIAVASLVLFWLLFMNFKYKVFI